MPADDQSLRLAARLARCAGFDAATGLPNLRHFLVALERELARALRRREPVSVLVVEGAAGMSVVQLAERVVALVRREDVVARLGENRIGLIIAAHEPEAAKRVARRLHEEIEPRPAGIGVRLVGSGGESDPVRVLSDAIAVLERTVPREPWSDDRLPSV